MVRQIGMCYLGSRSAADLTPEPARVALVIAFMLAESHGGGSKISILAPVSIPYWLVQVSARESILLSGVTDRTQSIEFTDNTALNTVRKILSSETAEAKNIPDVVERVLAALGSVERKKQYVKHIEQAGSLARIGRWMQETEMTAKPRRLDLKLDSQGALAISEQFRQLKDTAERRLATMEEIQKLMKEKVGAQAGTLASIVKRDRERKKKQSQSLEEIAELETSEISDKTRDILQALEEKHRMELRALTAEFARTSSSLEQFFSQVLESIRQSRIVIGQKAENVVGAVEEFRKLASLLAQNVPKYADSLRGLEEKAQDMLNRSRQLAEALKEQKVKATQSHDALIREHRHRIVDFDLERNQSENESEELLDRVKTSVARIETALEQRVQELRAELRQLSTFAFESSLVRGAAPLTLVDINTYVALYQNGDLRVFGPNILPSDRFGIPFTELPVEPALDDYLQKVIVDLSEASTEFKNGLRRALNECNLLGDAKAREELADGLQQLQARQLLKEGVAEAVSAAWNRQAGR